MFDRIRRKLAKHRQQKQCARALVSLKHGAPPCQALASLDDDQWLWANTEGARQMPELGSVLPTLPDEKTQLHFTSTANDLAMRNGFAIYRMVRDLARAHVTGGAGIQRVLDFGCGWGRVIRFFIRDIEPQNLWGIDCDRNIIEICQKTNRWAQFRPVDPFPPSGLPEGSFDLIYCYSVFSHLSEDAHMQWLEEFSHLLRAGGVLVATTRARAFIQNCDELRKQAQLQDHLRGAASAFADTAQALADYDQGRYVHETYRGSKFFGETAIPEAYVREHWRRHLEVRDFVDDRGLDPQNVIVARRA